MFSYRHAFHAGNHADVLKHLALLAALQHLQHKDTGLWLVDTHAGAGQYRLDHDAAQTSGEAAAGIGALWRHAQGQADTPPPVRAYLEAVAACNPDGALRHYPGSPALLAQRLRPQDRLALFEWHPTDGRLLDRQVRAWSEQWPHARITLRRDDGLRGLRALLPPPTRRALVLIDPSYELKTDYAAVVATVGEALHRFAQGCYLVWYPLIGREQAHALPKRLRALAQHHGRTWLQAELNVGTRPDPQRKAAAARGRVTTGLRASGMLIINPPYTLAERLRTALPWVLNALRQGPGAAWRVDDGEPPRA